MFVAASTECFPDLSPQEALEVLADLEYTRRRVADSRIGPRAEAVGSARRPGAMRPASAATRTGSTSPRSNIELAPGPDYYKHFASCCKLAKAIKVVTLVVPCSELGTPFNEEIERLRKLVEIASLEGAVVGLKTQIGRMTQDPDTAVVLCDNVKGLRLTLDPSHYITGPHQGGAHRQGDEVRAARAPARFDEAEAARPRRPGRNRLRQADSAARQGRLRSRTFGRT